MAWKDVDANGVPKLDFAHPRVKAAMKVTGIEEGDLFCKPPPLRSPGRPGALTARAAICDAPGDRDKGASSAGGATSSRGESLARSKELWERRQRQLLRELEATADKLDDADVDALLSPAGASPAAVEAESNKRKAQVDRMRERLMDQLRREAKREIERNMAHAAAGADREALAKRLHEQQKERHAKVVLQAEARAVQMAKVQEGLKKEMRKVVQKRQDITSKLEGAGQRVEKMIEDRHKGDSEKSQEHRSRMAVIAERKMAHEQVELEQKARRYEDALRHDREVEERLAKARSGELEHAQERRNKFSGKMEKVSEQQLQQEREREKAFLESAKKIDIARDVAVAKAKELQETLKAGRDKQLQKWTTNRQSLRQHRREYVTKLRSSSAEAAAKKLENRERYFEDLTLTKAANRGLLQDVVEQNKARRTRSDECAMGQVLAKIEREIARTETTLAQRQQLQADRVAAIKDSMLGRTKVEELRRLDPGAGEAATKRVNDILKQLDLPPLPTGAAKEGEEGQQQ